MNQKEAERRLDELEARKQQWELRPMLERLSAETGVSVDDILIEAERLQTTYGSDPLAIELGIAGELGLTVEQIRTEAEQVMDAA
jgi:hypothetical protein